MLGVTIIIYVLLLYLLLEGFLHIWIRLLKKRFDTLLTSEDLLPSFNAKALAKFTDPVKGSYDSELGWTRPPNTSKTEKFLGLTKSYSIDSHGSRVNPSFEDKPAKVLVFGDSYAFCREVNDDETFEHFLANKMNANVLNFGVGNYGMDQALLRFERVVNDKEIIKDATHVVMAVVPETLSRNLACWKHYNEFGNTFAFKPRFRLIDDKLELVNNFVNRPEKFKNLNRILPELNKYDYYYSEFKNNILEFPYSVNLIRKKKLRKFIAYSGVFILESLHIDWRSLSFLKGEKIKSSFDGSAESRQMLFEDLGIFSLSMKILKRFTDVAKKNNLIPIFAMLPQEPDLRFGIEKGEVYYRRFLTEAKSFVTCIDAFESFSKLKKPFDVFSQIHYSETYTVYGGHYETTGNKIVADLLYKAIEEKNTKE
jgi:hypothetical protein